MNHFDKLKKEGYYAKEKERKEGANSFLFIFLLLIAIIIFFASVVMVTLAIDSFKEGYMLLGVAKIGFSMSLLGLIYLLWECYKREKE